VPQQAIDFQYYVTKQSTKMAALSICVTDRRLIDNTFRPKMLSKHVG